MEKDRLTNTIVQHNVDAAEMALQNMVDAVACAQVEMDFFNVIGGDFPVAPGTTDLTPPFCVSAGQTIDFKMQLTMLDNVEDVVLALYRDGVLVAQA